MEKLPFSSFVGSVVGACGRAMAFCPWMLGSNPRMNFAFSLQRPGTVHVKKAIIFFIRNSTFSESYVINAPNCSKMLEVA